MFDDARGTITKNHYPKRQSTDPPLRGINSPAVTDDFWANQMIILRVILVTKTPSAPEFKYIA
jgi:hypothetical protein